MSGAQSPNVWTFLVEGKPRNVSVTPHITVNSFQVLCTLAIAGVGIVRVPVRHAERGLASGELKPFSPPARNAVIAYRSNRNVCAALRAMIDVVVARHGNWRERTRA